jgi:hypothetical protein
MNSFGWREFSARFWNFMNFMSVLRGYGWDLTEIVELEGERDGLGKMWRAVGASFC